MGKQKKCFIIAKLLRKKLPFNDHERLGREGE